MKLRAIATACITLTCAPAWSADPVQWAGNGHWYQFVGDLVTAEEAFTLAGAATFNGLTGYLATITTAEENAHVAGAVADGQLAWLGGSDNAAAQDNEWTWRVGPEAGQAFGYTNWGAGEPNNCCTGENYLHVNWAGGGLWNDHGSPGNAGQRNGYVIEFSAPVPEPVTYALMLAGLAVVGVSARRRRRG